MRTQKNVENFKKKLLHDSTLDDLHENLMEYVKTKLGRTNF